MTAYRYMLVMALSLLLSGCAVNSSTSNVTPGVSLADYESFHIVRPAETRNDLDILLRDGLVERGMSATIGTESDVPDETQVLVRYSERWVWDITTYLLNLNLQLVDAASRFPLANADIYHTSLSRKSPEQMVDDALARLLDTSASDRGDATDGKLSVRRMTAGCEEPVAEPFPFRVNVVGQGIAWATDETFQAALLESLVRCGLIDDAGGNAEADHTLLVSLQKAFDDHVLFSGVTVTAIWMLFETGSRNILFQSEVVTNFEDKVAAFVAPTPVRNDNLEIAVKRNLESGIRLLGDLDLSGLDSP